MKFNDRVTRRSTGLMLAKISIVALVLVLVCGFSIWSWLTTFGKGKASGISAVAKGDGVQVSWDGVDFYNALTAPSNEAVVENEVGLAKALSGADGTPAALKLITGNGLHFFEPTLNLRTGAVLPTADHQWTGTVVEENDHAGRFIDFDLYFRGTAEKDVYLTGKSAVLPKDETARISDYGAFSRDNIASAARVAFLNDEMTACSFIWAPNDDGHLVRSDGFKRVANASSGQGGVPSVPIADATDCVLVDAAHGVAISTGENRFKAVRFSDAAKSTVETDAVSMAEQFTVQKKGEGNTATYKFLSRKTGQYLAIADGNVVFNDAGSDFSLEYAQGYDGPILLSGAYVLTFGNAGVEAADKSLLGSVSAFTVYTGSGYTFQKDSTTQVYQYYDASNGLQTLNAESEPKLFTSTSTTSKTERIGNTKIATLTKANASDDYYTAHIVVRVWVEGTDREAALPLADGIFNMSLCFTAI